jgi:hypothetical protein
LRPVANAGPCRRSPWQSWLDAACLAPAYSADQQLFTIEYVWDEAAHSATSINNDGAPVPHDGCLGADRNALHDPPPLGRAGHRASRADGRSATSSRSRRAHLRLRIAANGAEGHSDRCLARLRRAGNGPS